MMKNFLIKIFSLFAVLSVSIMPSELPADKAEGVFFGVAVGPRLPIGEFSNTSEIGYGFNLEISYTNTDFLPFFIYANVGYEQYPGSQSFYKESDYSNFSTVNFPINLGARYYFAPIMENVVLFIPFIQAGASFIYMEELNEFKIGTGRNNFTEESSKYGVSVGGGVSMFLMELLLSYHYFNENQFVSFDLKVRIPLFINF